MSTVRPVSQLLMIERQSLVRRPPTNHEKLNHQQQHERNLEIESGSFQPTKANQQQNLYGTFHHDND